MQHNDGDVTTPRFFAHGAINKQSLTRLGLHVRTGGNSLTNGVSWETSFSWASNELGEEEKEAASGRPSVSEKALINTQGKSFVK